VFSIESSSSFQADTAPRVDEDFDGTGDFIEITDAFTPFSKRLFPVGGTGGALDVRSVRNLDGPDEDIAFDSLLLTGDLPPVPLPAAAWLFASGLLGLIGVARRKVRV
jgi:hypothetical protein